MWKRVIQLGSGLVIVVVAVFVLQKLIVVTDDDVAGYYDLGRPQADFQVQGGSIYALSPDLTQSEWLCTTQLNETHLEQRDQNILFQNSLAAALPFVDRVVSLVVPDAPSTMNAFRTKIEFSGVYTKLLTGGSGAQPKACEVRMVRLAATGFRICRVRSTLIAQGGSVFAAFNFDSDQIFIPEETFAAHGLERTGRIAANGALPCPRSVPLPWDARFRQKLKLVVTYDGTQTAKLASEG